MMWMLCMLWLVFAHDLLRVQIHGWRHVKLVFFVLFNMVHGFENVCESTVQTVVWIVIEQVKALKKVQRELVTTKKKMEKQETKRVLDNIYLRMPKQQEIFTSVAIVCNPCIVATRDSQLGNCEEELPKKPVGRLSVDSRPSVDQQSTYCWPTVGRLSTNSRPVDRQPFVGNLSADRFCPKYRLPVGRPSADRQPTVGWQLVMCR